MKIWVPTISKKTKYNDITVIVEGDKNIYIGYGLGSHYRVIDKTFFYGKKTKRSFTKEARIMETRYQNY